MGILSAGVVLGIPSARPDRRYGRCVEHRGIVWSVDTVTCVLMPINGSSPMVALEKPFNDCFVADICSSGENLVVVFGARSWSSYSGTWQVWRVSREGLLLQHVAVPLDGIPSAVSGDGDSLLVGVSSLEISATDEWAGGGIVSMGPRGDDVLYRHSSLSTRFSPSGLAAGPHGVLYFVDQGMHVLGRLDSAGPKVVFGELGIPRGDCTGLSVPMGVALSGDVIYIADSRNGRIVAVDVGGTFLGTSPQGRLADPRSVVCSQGILHVADTRRPELVELKAGDLVAGDSDEPVLERETELSFPRVIRSSDGVLLVADTNHNRVLSVTLDDRMKAVEVAALECSTTWPRGASLSPDGTHVAICDGVGAAVKIVQRSSGEQVAIVDSVDGRRIVDPHDAVWISETALVVADGMDVARVDGFKETVWCIRSPDPHQLALGEGESIHVADPTSGCILQLDRNSGAVMGSLSHARSSGGGTISLRRPRAVAAARNLLAVADENGSVLFIRDRQLYALWDGTYEVDGTQYVAQAVRGLDFLGDHLLVSDHRNHMVIAVRPSFGGGFANCG
ncbi:hypothetical protein [Nocardioides carbamazepini]|uniref:hypothetical protein n=1 Tax=Nocardioides carbamazepini TaxID=2854259 RepID=UPI00214A0B7F|nr:hypothetical protein [Nocardioides carbamazepini]